jgi:hypothetical protein
MKYKCDDCAAKCINVIANNFGYIVRKQHSLDILPPETLISVLQNEKMQVFSEDDVFNAILHYASQKVSLKLTTLKFYRTSKTIRSLSEDYSAKLNFLNFL